MDKDRAQKIVNSFAKKLKGFKNEASFVGIIDGKHVYYLEREHHGGHVGLPPYFSVSEEGYVTQLLPPEVFRAAEMRHRFLNN
jgi:hypothetical protein